MSVRRSDAMSRKTLFRDCFICGKHFSTTADTPFVRQVTNVNGKKQATVYFCSDGCKRKSYKHLFDGNADQRRREREARRDVKEKNHRYYLENADKIKENRRRYYYEKRDECIKSAKYQREKRKLLKENVSYGTT